MVEPAYSYCPVCGGKLVVKKHELSEHQVCSVCQRTLYTNQYLTVSAVIVKSGKMLVVERGIEPFKGELDLPGGYVEPTETAREAILRELKEELHVTGKILQPFEVLGPDSYPFEGVIHHNADMLYQVELEGGKELRPDDDVSKIYWIPLVSLSEVKFAFASHRQFITGLESGQYTLV